MTHQIWQAVWPTVLPSERRSSSGHIKANEKKDARPSEDE